MKRRTKLLLALGGLLLVAVLTFAVLLRTGVVTRGLRGTIAQQLAAATSRPTTVGGVEVGLGGRFVLRDVVLRYDDGSPLATLPEAEVLVGGEGVRGGLSQFTQIREITLRNPTIRLVRTQKGEWPSFKLSSKSNQPARFPEQIKITGAAFSFSDQQRGTDVTLRDINLTATSKQAGQVGFALAANGDKDAFRQLQAKGSYEAEQKRTEITLTVSNVDLTYAMKLLPPIRGISVAGGRADVDGTVTIVTPGGKQKPVITPNLTVRPRNSVVSFPWLHQPLRGVAGSIRIADRDITIDRATALLAGAPVTARGTVVGLPHATVGLDLSASGIGMNEVRSLFPKVTLPAGMTIRSPMRLTAKAQGKAPNVTISGRAAIGDLIFANMPWHDMEAAFTYTRGLLSVTGIRAHGSPRQLEADVTVHIAPGSQSTEASVVMHDVSLDSLSAVFPQLKTSGLSGTTDVDLKVKTGGGTAARGSFSARDVAYRQYQLGRVTGDFATDGTTTRVEHGTIAGAAATGTFSATVGKDGAYTVDGDLSAVNLKALGVPVPINATGGRVHLTGSAPQQRASGQIELTLAATPGMPVQKLSADLTLSPRELSLSKIVVQSTRGQATGDLSMQNWRAGSVGRLAGRFQLADVPVREWLPPQYAAMLPQASAAGPVEVGGSIADPRFSADLRFLSADTEAEIGRARASYEHGKLQIDEFQLTTPQAHLTVTGSVSQKDGLDLHATGVSIDLAALSGDGAKKPGTRRNQGLDLSGTVLADLTADGPLTNPHVTLKAASGDGLTVNDVPFHDLLVVGEVKNGVLNVDQASLRQQDGSISGHGTINLLTRQLDLTMRVDSLDLFNTMFIADQAVWRRFYLNQDGTYKGPVSTAYASIPRPLGGSLSADIRVTGPSLSPEVQVSDLRVDHFSFRGREIAKVTGGLTLALSRGALRSITIPNPGIVAASGESIARLWGNATFGGTISLNADVSTLDLSLLDPWLPGMAGLKGQASVNVDVTGLTSDPHVRGDVYVDNFFWRGLTLQHAELSPINWEGNQIVISGISLRNGPMDATGDLRLVLDTPLGRGWQPLSADTTGSLQIRNGRYRPVPGMEPASFDASLSLQGNTLYIERVNTEGPVTATPGVIGTLGGGTFTVGGKVVFPSLTLSGLKDPDYDLTIALGTEGKPVDVNIEKFASVKLAGVLRMVNGVVQVDDKQLSGPLLRTEEGKPLLVSEGWVSVPPPGLKLSSQGVPLAAPLTDILILAGDNLRFQYGGVRANVVRGVAESDPTTGYLHVTGPLTAQGVNLAGRFESEDGTLRFPNGSLDVESARADITKRTGQLMQVYLNASAMGTVGDYTVSLNPSGRVYPLPSAAEQPLAMGVRTIPSLSEPLALALLAGSVVTPENGTGPDPLELLSTPDSAKPQTGNLAGFSIPGPGLPNLSLDYRFEGPLSVRLRQRLLGRVHAEYTSPITGPTENRQTALTYQVSPRWSLGWGVNGLDQSQWQAQAFITF